MIIAMCATAPAHARELHADPQSLQAVQLQPGDTLYLAAGVYDQPHTITAQGTAEQPIVIRSATDGEAVIQGVTWHLDGAQHVILQDLTFRDGAPALVFGKNASHNIVRDCRFHNCPPVIENLTERTVWRRALSGVGTNANHNQLIGNEFKRPYGGYYDVNEGLNIHEGNQYWLIENNHFEGYMYGLQLGVGARSGPPAFHRVSNNYFTHCNHAMHIKTADNVISGNHIADMLDGYRGYGTGVYIRSSPRTVVENNRIERAQWAGIRVIGSDHIIRNNIITETPVGVWLTHHSYGAAGNSIWIVHNTILDARLPIWLEQQAQAFVYNNILVALDSAEPPVGIYVCGSTDTNPMATWNAEWYKRMAGRHESPATLIASHNLYSNCYPPAESPLDIRDRILSGEMPEDITLDSLQWWQGHDVLAAPGFVDVDRDDFRLNATSPARHVGRPLPNAVLDAAGTLRPHRPDLGALQYRD